MGAEGDIWIKDGGSNRRQERGEKKKHEEPHDLYSLTNITGVIKSRQKVGHVREKNCIKKFWWVNIRERDLGMDRRITLQWILKDTGW